MKKKSLLTLLAAVICFCVLPISAQAATYPVYVDHVQCASAVAKNNTTFLPMRVIFETCGAKVDWYPEGKQILATRQDGSQLSMRVGSKTATEVGANTTYTLAYAPYVENGVTYVPLRFVAESLHAQVNWRPETKIVDIFSQVFLLDDPNPTPTTPSLPQEYVGEKPGYVWDPLVNDYIKDGDPNYQGYTTPNAFGGKTYTEEEALATEPDEGNY